MEGRGTQDESMSFYGVTLGSGMVLCKKGLWVVVKVEVLGLRNNCKERVPVVISTDDYGCDFTLGNHSRDEGGSSSRWYLKIHGILV